MASQQQTVEQLFEAALSLSGDARQAYLHEASRGDPKVRMEVERLLREHERAGSFLDRPLLHLAPQAEKAGRYCGTEDSPGSRPASASDDENRFQAGDILGGRFTVVRFIARGGMGEVYEVEDGQLQGVHVALKVILPLIGGDPAWKRRLEQEVLLAREVVHPNLCPIYDIFHCEQPLPRFSFLTMKLLPGTTLAARFTNHESLPLQEAERIFVQMTAGLAAVHAAGIVHRDIKPNNVMLRGEGASLHLWITDFGLARTFEADRTLQTVGGISGTPGYLAPELLHGAAPTEATDLFAYGVLLHQVFTGERPTPKPGGFSMVPSARLRSGSVPPIMAELVTECLDDDPQRRCRAFGRARGLLAPEAASHRALLSAGPRWTRRRFVTAGAAAATVAAAGGVWQWPKIKDTLHPLPQKRFVALLTWPPAPNARVKATLAAVIDAIEEELSRAEAFDRNLFVISPRDLQELATPAQLSEAGNALGANLVLAASGDSRSGRQRLSLRVLDPPSTQALREKQITYASGQELSLPVRAVRAAAELLSVGEPTRKAPASPNPGTQSPEAYAAYQAAEMLRRPDNDAGLDAAIEKYKQALELDPKYAMAYAKLALAYGRYYAVHHDPATLLVAKRNYETALLQQPDLVEGHLARAFVMELTGDESAALRALAKALSIDPSNPRILLEQAQILDRLNRWGDAEKIFERVLRQRPNYWQAYNALGAVYNEQGKFREAMDAFRQASVAAPRAAIAYNNIASIHLQLGNDAAAVQNAKKSFDLSPNALAAETMAAALRFEHKYPEALQFARKAVQLDPTDPTAWLEMGDCLSLLHSHTGQVTSAYQQGAEAQEEQIGTDTTYGPGWIVLGLCRAKANSPGPALAAIRKAETLPSDGLDAQLYKARALEAVGLREEALRTLQRCFSRGATRFQVELMPDMDALRADSRYIEIVQGRSVSTPT